MESPVSRAWIPHALRQSPRPLTMYGNLRCFSYPHVGYMSTSGARLRPPSKSSSPPFLRKQLARDALPLSCPPGSLDRLCTPSQLWRDSIHGQPTSGPSSQEQCISRLWGLSTGNFTIDKGSISTSLSLRKPRVSQSPRLTLLVRPCGFPWKRCDQLQHIPLSPVSPQK